MKRRALLSVYDKTGITEFAAFLTEAGFSLLSTGGTFRELQSAGLAVEEVSAYTGAQEIMDGRVKTLHPRIHGGILGRRDQAEDLQAMQTLGMDAIDVVVVNLYPFFEKSGAGLGSRELLEFIDIGGPSMLRAAAKNYSHVMVASSPEDYPLLMEEWQKRGEWSLTLRRQMAARVFALTSAYDSAVADFLACGPGGENAPQENAPQWLHCSFRKASSLRYGENPHQKAAWYVPSSPRAFGALSDFTQHQGKAPSFNNLRDLDAAWRAVCDFGMPDVPAPCEGSGGNLHVSGCPGPFDVPAPCEGRGGRTDEVENARCTAGGNSAGTKDAGGTGPGPAPLPAACVGLKHGAPCGAALAATALEAWELARAGDPVSIFGGIAAFNREVDAPAAESLAGLFLELVAAPGYTTEALDILARKKNLRVLSLKRPPQMLWEAVPVDGGITLQQTDRECAVPAGWTVPTRLKPDDTLMDSLSFAWKLVRHVKSNGIVVARRNASVGIGNGQPSRVGAVRLALKAAGEKARGSVLASDAFFPFADWVEEVAAAGVKAVIQPGGSVRDEESIQACDKAGLAMVFTGRRHFRH